MILKNDAMFILNKFWETINPFFCAGKEKRKFRDGLVSVNAPALLGKRDALYEKALMSLNAQKDFFILPPEKRKDVYEKNLICLISGIEVGKHIFFGDVKEGERNETDHLNCCMLFLSDTIHSAFLLCRRQMIFGLGKEGRTAEVAIKKALEPLSGAENLFLDAEKKTFECVKLLTDKVAVLIEKHKGLLKKSMNKNDDVRYKKAYSEFLNLEISFDNGDILSL